MKNIFVERGWTTGSTSIGKRSIHGTKCCSIRQEHPDNNLKLPMSDKVRSLNLASTANTVVYEAVRQFGGLPSLE